MANGNSDYVSVIDATTRQVTDSIAVGLFGKPDTYIGSSPNALALDSAGTTLYVANGLDNALAVVSLAETEQVRGYVPTQAYPSGIALLDSTLYVANLEGNGARVATEVEMRPNPKLRASKRIRPTGSWLRCRSFRYRMLRNWPIKRVRYGNWRSSFGSR